MQLVLIVANHCHLSVKEGERPEDLIRDLNKYGIAKAVVYPPIPPISDKIRKHFPGENQNKWVAKVCREYEDRLIPWATVDLSKDLVQQAEEAYELECRGFKMHPQGQGFKLLDSKLTKFFEKLEELKMPVLFHTGYHGPDPWITHPMYVDLLSRRHPELIIIMEHMSFPFYLEAATVAAHRENVYLGLTKILRVDHLYKVKLSRRKGLRVQVLVEDEQEYMMPQSVCLPPEKLVDFVKTIGADKFIWGADWPMSRRLDIYINVIKSTPLTEEEKELILGKNILRLSRAQ